jgi:transcriptional regulator with XRE-family HTH domain
MQPGKSLKELRARLGITAREVKEQSQKIAEVQGNPGFVVSHHCLTKLENTDRVPSIRKVFSLSAVYRVKISDLLPMFGIDQSLLQKYQIETAPQSTQLINVEDPDSAKAITLPVRFDPGFPARETNSTVIATRIVDLDPGDGPSKPGTQLSKRFWHAGESSAATHSSAGTAQL